MDVRLWEVEVVVEGEEGRREVEGMTKEERVLYLEGGEKKEVSVGWYPWYSLQRPLIEKAKFLFLESISTVFFLFFFFLNNGIYLNH